LRDAGMLHLLLRFALTPHALRPGRGLFRVVDLHRRVRARSLTAIDGGLRAGSDPFPEQKAGDGLVKPRGRRVPHGHFSKGSAMMMSPRLAPAGATAAGV